MDKELKERIARLIGELSVRGAIAKQDGDKKLELACKQAIRKLIAARDKLEGDE